MKLFTFKILLTCLIFCVSFGTLGAFVDSLGSFFHKGISSKHPFPEKDLSKLDEQLKEKLLSEPENEKLINLQDAIKYAKWLIAEKPTNETRSPFDQRTIDKALKEVSKQYINLPKSWKKNFESVGKLGGAVAIGAIIGGYGKDYVQQWWANRNTGSPAKKPEKGAGNGGAAAGGPGKANFPGNLFAGDNKVVPNPKTVTDDFPWIWVIIGALVAVVIGLALYLNQDSLFGSGGYGEDEGYDDGTTKKTKKGKRRGSKQRKRRHSI